MIDAAESLRQLVRLGPWNNWPKLVILSEILQFDAGRFAINIAFLVSVEKSWHATPQSVLDATIPTDSSAFLLEGFKNLAAYCADAGFNMTLIPVRRIIELWSDLTISSLMGLCANAEQRLRDEGSTIRLVRVRSELITYYEQPARRWQKSITSFPHCAEDIEEAGKCLALGRGTASVFHLMRILEVGLQALAAVFAVDATYSNWGTILREIEDAIKGMERNPRWTNLTDWKEKRQAYAEAAGQFSVFRDAWRNHVSHSRTTYTEEKAADVYGAVRAFMESLSKHTAFSG